MSGFGRKMEVRTRIEKRRSERVATTTPAAVQTTSSRIAVKILDFSPGGAGLLSESPPQRGKDVQLCVGGLTLFGAIAWRNGETFGLRFEEALGEREWTRLYEVVRDAEAEMREIDPGTALVALANTRPDN